MEINNRNIETSREDVERVNPVFNTAKATVYQLAMSGNVDAIKLVEALKMTREETQASADYNLNDEKIFPNLLMMETRYGTVMNIKLSGRIDSISAPDFLAVFEKANAENEVDSVEVDCKQLAYISSAGLRILLMISKLHDVYLNDVNDTVRDILSQTGFDQIVKVR